MCLNDAWTIIAFYFETIFQKHLTLGNMPTDIINHKLRATMASII